MHYLIKIFFLPILFINLLHANDIYEINAPGVVLLVGDLGYGSGVIISSKGYVLTNNHVVEGNENLKVILSYKYNLDEYEEYVHSIEIIKQDKLRDLAWDEIIQCGIIKKDVKFKNTKVVKIAKTFRVPKINFFNFLNEIELNLKNKFGSNVNMLGQGIFTRHKFVKELLNKLK